MISVINEFGAADVVQAIQDGTNKATWPIIEREFPWIVCSWCAAHVIHLWFEDIGKMVFFKDIWEQGKMVVIWIRGHQAFAARFGKLSRKSLLLPGERVFHLLHARKCSEIGSIQETRASGRHLSCSAVKFQWKTKLLSECTTEN